MGSAHVLAIPFGKAVEDGLNSSDPASVEDSEETTVSWLKITSAPAIKAPWRMNQRREDLSLHFCYRNRIRMK